MAYLLALDQGTSSSRSIIFDEQGQIVASAQQEFRQIFPQPGWVEHDANEIWQSQFVTCQQAMRNARLQANDIAAIGITNQRETTVLWDKKPASLYTMRSSGKTAAPPRIAKSCAHRVMLKNSGKNRADTRSVFFGKQTQMAARSYSRRTPAGGTR
jgi:sugar (pentulose or hexulose) kinase